MNIREIMNGIFSEEYNGKPIWEHIRDNELAAAPAFKGALYDECSTKIMYVGHAVNGWGFDTSECKTLDATLDATMNQKDSFNTFVNAEGYPYTKSNGKPGTYYHINSNFLRLIKQVLEYQGESDSPTSHESWYSDSKHWEQKFVWSNLYNIAPRDGGNPGNDLIKPYMDQYTEMIRIQIEEYKPDIVIFCPLSGYFRPWMKKRSFQDILDTYEDCNIEDTIVGKGKLGESQIIVCNRPDRRGKSREDVLNMAKCISDYINEFCK